MSATSNWNEIRKKRATPEVGEAIAQQREIIDAELRLAGLRKRRKRSQVSVAAKLSVSQARVSKLERGADPKLSTVANYIDALGGRLELRAVFDDETVEIRDVGTVGTASAEPAQSAGRGGRRARSSAEPR